MEDGNSPGAAFEGTFGGCIHVLVISDKSIDLHTLRDISLVLFIKNFYYHSDFNQVLI